MLNIVLLKSQNFDAIKPHKYTVSCGDPVTFLGKFFRRRVLMRTRIFGFPKKLKRSQNYDFLIGFIVGNNKTSLIVSAPVTSITRRSTPTPNPPVGGMPYSIAVR